MKLFTHLVSSAIVGLNVLLIFLWFFQSRIVFPAWVQSVGRMHPLLLHLPIGTFVISLLLILFKKEFKEQYEKIIKLTLSFSAVTASLAAIMGFILSNESGYDESLLKYHLVSGVALSLLTWLLASIDIQKEKLFNSFAGFTFVVLIVTGHFGSVITHGDKFIFEPLTTGKEAAPITDSTTLYQAAIEPILAKKCVSCHNEQKKKGNLLMTSVEAILVGGKHGAIWKSGSPRQSELITRINLPEENEEHMPPTGKTPLTVKEKLLLYHWILEGADTKRAWTKFNGKDSLMLLANEFITVEKNNEQNQYSFPFASQAKIKELNSPYLTVTQSSIESPALAAEFFVSQSFDLKNLEALTSVKEQLTDLNLAGMPVTDAEGVIINNFKNLEKLNLNQTKITGAVFKSLNDLKKLRILSLAGTSIDLKSLEQLSTFSELKEVFVWNTGIDKTQLEALEKINPVIQWNVGYPPLEVLRLTPPLLVNDSLLIKEGQRIQLKHNLAGTIIRYTLDGTRPDSVKGMVYKEPIDVTGFTVLKAIACRDEWLSSSVSEFTFFKSGYKPTSAELLTIPNITYKGEGAKTLIDAKKSTASDFRENGWLGFREQPLEALFYFDNPPPLKTVTLAFAKNYYSYLVPPETVELWVGNDARQLKLLKTIKSLPPKKDDSTFGEGAIIFELKQVPFKYYKIIATPVAKLPEFISKKREKAWLFVDEVIFN